MNDFGSQTKGQEQLPGGGSPPGSRSEVWLAGETPKPSHDCDCPVISVSNILHKTCFSSAYHMRAYKEA